MNASSSSSPYLILIDAHVHVYDCFSLPSFLDSAYRNFRAEACRQGKDLTFTGILLFTETSQDNWFRRLCACADNDQVVRDTAAKEWRFRRTAEASSLLAKSSEGHRLILVAGRQVVTAEDLEVLALCTDAMFDDGLPLAQTVKTVHKIGGLPTIPWGAGKWLGRRGALLTEFLKDTPATDIFLGDNSARPKFWSAPRHFRIAREKGIKVLPGTDPLPFSSETWRPGSFGFAIGAIIDPDYPANSLTSVLKDSSTDIQPYGSLESTARFLRNQVAMQLRKRFRRRAVST